jgi:hypothetical protein
MYNYTILIHPEPQSDIITTVANMRQPKLKNKAIATFSILEEKVR